MSKIQWIRPNSIYSACFLLSRSFRLELLLSVSRERSARASCLAYHSYNYYNSKQLLEGKGKIGFRVDRDNNTNSNTNRDRINTARSITITISTTKSMMMKIIDIGANLTDGMYQGEYHGKKKHEADLDDVLQRSFASHVSNIFITGGSLTDCQHAIELSQLDDRLFATVGCHPTRCGEFEKNGDPEGYYNSLKQLAVSNRHKVIALGECGLDYDRLQFCDKDVQLKYFEKQFDLAEDLKLPMFLHSRNAADDMVSLLTKHRDRFPGGVVHSFDGSAEEAKRYIELDLFIGINGCSLKTQQNLDVMKTIPSERLMIETDAPWCEVKRTHAGHQHVKSVYTEKKADKWEKGCMVKNRNEPIRIMQVLEVMAAVRDEDLETLADCLYKNTTKLFNIT